MRRFAAPSRSRFATSYFSDSYQRFAGLEVRELEDNEPRGIPVSFEHCELAAAHDEAAATGMNRIRRRSLVPRVLLGVVDVGLDDHVGGHAWIVRVEQQSNSPEETEALAAGLARRLAAGDLVTVAGELGSGKTTFVRGACGALGVRERVTSPTYTIGHRYHGDGVEVSHLDLYRFEGVSPAEWGDLEPYFEGAIAFVEWPEAGEGVLPAPRYAVRLRHAGAGRAVEIEEC
jgi:tRNA threonylcarbamoyladenosine biosynthesis protein TsaE